LKDAFRTAGAVPLELFTKIVGDEIAAYNSRGGRRTQIAAGRSFNEAFAESIRKFPVKVATVEQRRLCLLAAEQVRIDDSGVIKLFGNRYHSDITMRHRNTGVVARFDPENLHGSIAVYLNNGAYLCDAECHAKVAFNDHAKAAEFARTKNQRKKAIKSVADAERKLADMRLAAADFSPEGDTPPAPKVVKPMRVSSKATPPHPRDQQKQFLDNVARHARQQQQQENRTAPRGRR
jgi:putative transposase